MITGFFGTPGVGKTTFLTMFAQKELKRISKGKSPYEVVYTNFFCDGCMQIDFSQLGNYYFHDCLILLDEITLDADSRDFKSFGHEKKVFFLGHRHDNIDIKYFCQQYDGIDKKIKDITQVVYFVKKGRLPFLNRFSHAKLIYRTLDIDELSHQIVCGYRFPNIFERLLFKTSISCYRPKWYPYFDSYESYTDNLVELEKIPWIKRIKECLNEKEVM